MRGKCIMFQGTASSVGKSTLCAAMCRILKQDGCRVAPFKAQNMALNSFVTKEGLEMGRAQVTQAQAAGIEPSVRMNPVLLKPTSDRRSQVVVCGKVLGTMTAMEYNDYKPALREQIRSIYEALEAGVDAVVIEGAGSPAEINLREGDIVNMSMAEAADAPVILIGDINLGGVFASLLGTVMLLTDEERARVKGVIINKFRGDVRILEPGLKMLEERIHIPVLGVVPWIDIDLEDEDSVTDRFERTRGMGQIHVAIVRLAHISNFTDFNLLSAEPGVSVRYAARPRDLEGADIVILPGTKNTIEDLLELRENGMADTIVRHARAGGIVIGICGGYQMLGRRLRDPSHAESSVPECEGLGLLDMDVTFLPDKTTAQASGTVVCESGWLSEQRGMALDGYEIHMGENAFGDGCVPAIRLNRRGGRRVDLLDGVTNVAGNVFGTYLHGVFDGGGLWRAIVNRARTLKGMDAVQGSTLTLEAFREREFDRLADIVRQNVDMEAIRRILFDAQESSGRGDA